MTDRALIVVTRFAVRWPAGTWPSGRRPADPGPHRDWVRDRFELLRQTTAPALARVRPPVWWVWLAEPEMLDLAATLSCLLPDHRITVTTPRQRTLCGAAPGFDRFITVRLDSDDMFLPGALTWLAGRSWPERTLVDFACGFQWDRTAGHCQLLRTRRSWQGPFLAVTHETRATMLDFGGHHVTEARRDRSVHRVRRPSWVQTVHGDNIVNRMVTLTPRQWRRNQQAVPLPSSVGQAVLAGLRPQEKRDVSEELPPPLW